MIILEINKFLQKIIGLQTFGGSKYAGHIIVPILILFPLFLFTLSAIINFIVNLNDDISTALSSLLPFFSSFMYINIFCHILINRKGFNLLFDGVQALINQRMNLNGYHALYTQSEERVKFYNKIFSSVFVVPIVSLAPFVQVAFHWCMGIYTIDSWSFFWPFWTPFELNGPYCSMAVLLQCYCVISSAISYYAIICLFTEMTLYAKTFITDIKSIFVKVDGLAKSKAPELSLLECCKEAVDLHETVYRCMHQFAEVANFIILMIVIPLVLLICVSLVFIEKHNQSLNLDIMYPISAILFCLQMLFTCFYFGQKLHSDLMELNEMIYQSEWYRYPRSVRRFVMLMMMRAQQPYYLSAYGFMKCTLENFVAVLKWIYSAFMLLHGVD